MGYETPISIDTDFPFKHDGFVFTQKSLPRDDGSIKLLDAAGMQTLFTAAESSYRTRDRIGIFDAITTTAREVVGNEIWSICDMDDMIATYIPTTYRSAPLGADSNRENAIVTEAIPLADTGKFLGFGMDDPRMVILSAYFIITFAREQATWSMEQFAQADGQVDPADLVRGITIFPNPEEIKEQMQTHFARSASFATFGIRSLTAYIAALPEKERNEVADMILPLMSMIQDKEQFREGPNARSIAQVFIRSGRKTDTYTLVKDSTTPSDDALTRANADFAVLFPEEANVLTQAQTEPELELTTPTEAVPGSIHGVAPYDLAKRILDELATSKSYPAFSPADRESLWRIFESLIITMTEKCQDLPTTSTNQDLALDRRYKDIVVAKLQEGGTQSPWMRAEALYEALRSIQHSTKTAKFPVFAELVLSNAALFWRHTRPKGEPPFTDLDKFLEMRAKRTGVRGKPNLNFY